MSIDDLLSKAQNKFILANAVILRAKQISDGSLPYVDNFDPTNPITTALKEISADRISVKLGKKKEAEVAVVEEEKPKRKLSLVKESRGKKKKKK
ncbi:DNA-directed RNA polymerase subunit omega [Candidatus Margulisiibacteriota bacterium]